MLKIKTAGFNILLDMADKAFFEQRFADFTADFSCEPDFYFCTRIVNEVPVPQGEEKTAPSGMRLITSADGTITSVSFSSEGIPVRSLAVNSTSSEARLSILDGHTFRYLTRTGMEYSCSCMVFSDLVALRGGLVLHGAAIGYRQKGIIFSARPGVGKSTQAGLWQSLWPDSVARVNDDRPVISFADGRALMHGLPWSGSADLKQNVCMPLGAVVMVQRADENSVCRLEPRESFPLIFTELCKSGMNSSASEAVYDSLDRLLKAVPVYLLRCTISTQAPMVLRAALQKDGML